MSKTNTLTLDDIRLFKFNIMAAVDSNFNIGKNNKLPWRITDELAYFKKVTSPKNNEYVNYCICGYNTWRSMRSSKWWSANRKLFVVDRQAQLDTNTRSIKSQFITPTFYNTASIVSVPSFKIALQIISLLKYNYRDNGSIYAIGGRSIYDDAFYHDHLIDKLYLTVIKKKYSQCDTQFPIDKMHHMKLIKCDRLTAVDVLTNNSVCLEFCCFTQHYSYKYKTEGLHICKYINQHPHDYYNHPEKQYLNLVHDIIKFGIDCKDRTGVGTKSLFGVQMRFDLSDGFPLLTTKRMPFKMIVHELLWFLSGSTNVKLLRSHGIDIWNKNSSRQFLDKRGLVNLPEDYIGPAYGFQFRHSGGDYEAYLRGDTKNIGGIDQVQHALDLINYNPTSRRIIINLWHPTQLSSMALPPCLYSYHFRVYNNTLSCAITQRSGDVGLGVPFNIASASLLIHIFSKLSKLKPGTLIHTIDDAHIYNNHIEPIKAHLTRNPLPLPRLKISNRTQLRVEDFRSSDFNLDGYMNHPPIRMAMAV